MDSYKEEIVTRCAPRWAWGTIDETLAMDNHSHAFSPALRRKVGEAFEAMIRASEFFNPDD